MRDEVKSIGNSTDFGLSQTQLPPLVIPGQLPAATQQHTMQVQMPLQGKGYPTVNADVGRNITLEK